MSVQSKIAPQGAKTSNKKVLAFVGNPAPLTNLSGYDYLEAHLGHDRVAKLTLLNFEGLRGEGGDYAYEALNLANGSRTTSEIRDALSAIYGPVPQDAVDQFLAGAAEGGLVIATR